MELSEEEKNRSPITQQIYSVIDSLEDKFNRRAGMTSSVFGGINKNFNITISPNPLTDEGVRSRYNMYNMRNGVNPPSSIPGVMSPSNEFLIRKLIKEEFDTLIVPYQTDMFNNFNVLDKKISEVAYGGNKNNINTNFSIPLKPSLSQVDLPNNINLSNYIQRPEFDLKIIEISQQINKIKEKITAILQSNSVQKSTDFEGRNNADNREINEINDRIDVTSRENKRGMKEFEIKFDDLTLELEKLKKKITALEEDTVALETLKKKDTDKSNKLEELEKAVNNYKGNISSMNDTVNKIQSENGDILKKLNLIDVDNLKELNVYELKNLNIAEIKGMKVTIDDLASEYKSIKTSLNEIKKNSNVNNNNNNKILEAEVSDVKEKVGELETRHNNELNKYVKDSNENYDKISKDIIEINNKIMSVDFSLLSEIQSKLMTQKQSNEDLFNKFAQYETIINDLNTKISIINESHESEFKKRFGQLQNKLEKSINDINDQSFNQRNTDRGASSLNDRNEDVNKLREEVNKCLGRCEEFDGRIKGEIAEISEKIKENERKIFILEQQRKEGGEGGSGSGNLEVWKKIEENEKDIIALKDEIKLLKNGNDLGPDLKDFKDYNDFSSKKDAQNSPQKDYGISNDYKDYRIDAYLDKKDSEKPKTDMFLTGFGHEKNDATDGLEDLLSEASEKKKKEVENPFRKASDEKKESSLKDNKEFVENFDDEFDVEDLI